jgi:hypothetical protein
MNPYTNKYTSISALLPAMVLAAGAATAAGPAEWAPSGGDDLRIESLPESTPAVPQSRHAESEPVSYAWPLTVDRSAPAPTGPSMESREYWVDATGRELERGLKLPLSSAGAIVRISALHAGSGVLLDADRLAVDVDGQSLPVTHESGGLKLFTGSDLQAQGMSVPTDTLAFQLPERGQPRSLDLQLAGAPAEQPLVVHVFEPESPWMARLSAEHHNFLTGDELKLDVGLTDGEERFAAQSVQAVLVSPDAANAWPLEVGEDGFTLKGTTPQSLPETGEGLYEVHAYLEGRRGDTMIRRDLKIALDIAAPTARLTESLSAGGDRGLTVDLGVDVAAQGRYQVSGQVWGTADNGEMRPLAMAQTAAVLEPGAGQLQLDVPADLVMQSGLSAPFEVREVQLLDQGRMAVLETRSRGFTIGRDTEEPRRPFDTIDQ